MPSMLECAVPVIRAQIRVKDSPSDDSPVINFCTHKHPCMYACVCPSSQNSARPELRPMYYCIPVISGVRAREDRGWGA